jgi:hypothetical protein
MTISGAAASPAAGMYTATLQSFAATLFNIRLGYWLPNPRMRPSARDSASERLAQRGTRRGWAFWPYYLLLEMFGQTTAARRMVNLSDGGHTGDNLGLVPLLQRRCDLIIACDAGCDPKRTCEDLAASLRIAYVEENVVVDIDPTQLQPATAEQPGLAYALGTIYYPSAQDDLGNDRDAPAKQGLLIYLKSTLPSGRLPVAARAYAVTHPEFPHESTGDQFFDDAQFEAYRSLGEALATRMLRDLGGQQNKHPLYQLLGAATPEASRSATAS